MEGQRADFGKITEDERLTADEMDSKRSQAMAYEYLCHLEEAKQWMEYCISEEIPPSTELEESLRNGVTLAKLAHYFAPDKVPARKIYDKDLKRFEQKGLHFKHTDNINAWFRAMEHVGLPKIFYPETTDIYDRKNMPRTIYCLHALSLYLFKLGKAPQMKDLYGIAEFTEEQLTIMQTELEKYGIHMPQFNKIGGILANEMSVDEAALHAAVIAINEALESGDVEETCSKLLNPQAMLEHVNRKNAEQYQKCLLAHKRSKQDAARAKKEKLQNSEITSEVIKILAKDKEDVKDADRDMYEELLTHAELQGNLNNVNLDIQLSCLDKLLQNEDCDTTILQLLKDMNIKNVEDQNETWYKHQLIQHLDAKKSNQQNEDAKEKSTRLDKEEVQNSVVVANEIAYKHRYRKSAVASINKLLGGDHSDESGENLMKHLQDPTAGFGTVYCKLPNIHYEELNKLKENKVEELTHEDILKQLPQVNKLAELNELLQLEDTDSLWKALKHPDIGLNNLDERNRGRICESLIETKKQQEKNIYLTKDNLQNIIDQVNFEVAEEVARLEAVNNVNSALETDDIAKLLEALQNTALKLQNVDADNITHYSRLLHKNKSAKSDDGKASLWIDDIQSCVNVGNQQTRAALKQAAAVYAVNTAIDSDDWETCYEMLKHADLAITGLTIECASTYHEGLQMEKQNKIEEGGVETTWVSHKTKEGDAYYFNVDTLDGNWNMPENFNPNSCMLSKENIQEQIKFVSAAYDRCQFFTDNEYHIVKLQSFARMIIAKRRYKERKNFMDNQLPAIICIQSAFRGYVQRKKYQERLNYLKSNVNAIIMIQKYVRMWKLRKAFQDRMNYLQKQNKYIVKLQAWFRSNKARHDYKTLIGVENPPLPVVQRFIHLLDQRARDFAEELELQELKKSVIQRIKSNNEHEKALNTMDIKIGLLVKNRISLQDVINHSASLRKRTAKDMAAGDSGMAATGLKALNRANRARLEAYQHLFYMLQTNPTYLGKLIFKIESNRGTNFIQQVIFGIYNYASNHREEYLLLKLFRTALQEEIESKVDQVKEIATGNPLVIKMVVSFNRGAKGNSCLRQILAPQVLEILKQKTPIIPHPGEIYKAWISQTETETGEPSTLPYEATIQEALKHEEVRIRMDAGVKQLQHFSEGLMNSILSSADKIPYGLRYIAKCLRNLLSKKFPHTEEDEVQKMVGNLIYYRFINPAITAPDAFDIIDVGAGGSSLNNDQRKYLAFISKVVNFSASGKTFQGEMDYMNDLNDYMTKAYKRFKQFFKSVCDVPEPEEKFNMDEFSDAVLLSKPVIFISLKEVIDTHRLLLEHEDEIAPEAGDPLHDMLAELGDVPDQSTLLASSEGNDQQDEEALKAEISLTLSSRVQVEENDNEQDIKNLLLRTKRMVIDIIRTQGDENLELVLNTPATDEQEDQHIANINKMQENQKCSGGGDAKEEGLLKTRSLLNENKLPLEDMKKRVARNLEKLVAAKIVSKEDNYQAIVNMIARDIRNQRRYRQRRKQELTKLKQNEERLKQKSKSLEEQSEYFNQYIKSCLASLTAKSKQQKKKKKKKAQVCKYTAAELNRKKILLEVEGLEINKFREVLFEIAQSDEDHGKFFVAAKFFGVSMEKVTLVFQDLLQLQYEGVNHMKMFDGRAKINVNLLIFLLNKKFYGK